MLWTFWWVRGVAFSRGVCVWLSSTSTCVYHNTGLSLFANWKSRNLTFTKSPSASVAAHLSPRTGIASRASTLRTMCTPRRPRGRQFRKACLFLCSPLRYLWRRRLNPHGFSARYDPRSSGDCGTAFACCPVVPCLLVSCCPSSRFNSFTHRYSVKDCGLARGFRWVVRLSYERSCPSPSLVIRFGFV